MPSRATPRPLLSLGAPPQNNLFLGALPHQDPLSQPPPPTRVGAGAPTGGWGAVGPPVGWASGQHGGGVCGEKTAACPGPAGPASPAAGRTSGTGGSVGDNSSRRPAKGGERRGRGSARGTRGKGKAGGRGRGGLTLAPPAPPRAATRPRGPQRPAPQPWRPAGASRAPAGGAGQSLAVHTYDGNNLAIGCCCQELNQLQSRTAVARRRGCGRRSRAQTKSGSEARLPPPSLPSKTATSGLGPFQESD